MPIVRAASVLVLAWSANAAANPAIVDRNYGIDLYEGVALGNSATVAMGGASAANAFGTSGTLVNPSAPAVRRTTDTDRWSWDYHLDYLNASLSKDYDNNGVVSDRSGLAAFTAGLGGRWQNWGAAVTASAQNAPIADAMVAVAGGTYTMSATTLRLKVAVAKWFPQIDTAIGVAANTGQLTVQADCSGPTCNLFQLSGEGLEAGATWIPRMQDFRIGAALASRVIGGNVTTQNCDPNNCAGYILPDEVVSGWRLVAGGAYRWAPERWNQLVGGTFRDERSVTVVSDIVVTGSAPHGYGLEAFGQHELQRSGKNVDYSLRGGVEYEWLPGRLRVRGGSYWEPGRFEGVGGRLHGTFGIEVRVLEFHAWGRRRGRITLTGDVADRYQNLGISIGFWH